VKCQSGREQAERLDFLLSKMHDIPFGDEAELNILHKQLLEFWQSNLTLQTPERTLLFSNFTKQFKNK
jgi:hypothetical protein